MTELLPLEMASNKYKDDFETVYGIISAHRNHVIQQVNGEAVLMAWEVGGFVFSKLKTSA